MRPSNKDEKFDVDLNVSNIKTISLEVLLAGDKRLQAAHQAAVNKMLVFLEQHRPILSSGDEDADSR